MKNENTCIDYTRVGNSSNALAGIYQSDVFTNSLNSLIDDLSSFDKNHDDCLSSEIESLSSISKSLSGHRDSISGLWNYLSTALSCFSNSEAGNFGIDSGLLANKVPRVIIVGGIVGAQTFNEEKFKNFIKNSDFYTEEEKNSILNSELVYSKDAATFKQNMTDDVKNKIEEQTKAFVTSKGTTTVKDQTGTDLTGALVLGGFASAVSGYNADVRKGMKFLNDSNAQNGRFAYKNEEEYRKHLIEQLKKNNPKMSDASAKTAADSFIKENGIKKGAAKTTTTTTTTPADDADAGGGNGGNNNSNNKAQFRVEDSSSSNTNTTSRENPSNSNTQTTPAPGETPKPENPGNNTGGNETPKPENPGNNTGGNETPKPENPGNNTGGNETPKPENPGNNTGGNETQKPENPGNNGNTNTGGNTNNNQGTAQRPTNNSGNHVSYNPSGSNNQQGASSGPTEAPSTGTTVPTPKPDTSGDMDIISIDKTPAKDTANASASSGGSNVIPIALGVAAAGAAAVAGTRFIKKRSEQQNSNEDEYEDNYQIEDENLLKDLDEKIESSTSMPKESLDANSLSSLDDLTNTKQSQETEQKVVSVPNQELNFAQPESSFKYQAGSINKLNLEDGRDVRIEDETIYGTNKEELE